ncbi:hypothetical protein [Sulfurimonas sp. C5]|uniref:hypothetical protein n=1 Tax=Sulfurimonas sp. C5 TaxID=3036947 RepID=UPI002457CBD8|nr:hypothetical protein [Sulfurimonas sp. C5]MDH4944862.1 hypothetical protein [Sulfurimonas sp. C5]
MEELSLKTKRQIVLSRIIYDYIINGLASALENLSEQEIQLLVMRLNIQAITHAIEIANQEEITDFDYCFDQLGITFETLVPLSQVEFTPTFIDAHINDIRCELGDEFEDMVIYLKKMETTVI